MFVDVEQRTVILLASSEGELDVGPYGTDYVFVLTMTDDGSMVRQLHEWPDFSKVEGTLKKMQSK